MHNDARHLFEKTPQLETKQQCARFSAYVDEAIRQALRDQPAELPNDSAVLYHRSFPVGSALADIFAYRAVRDGLPLSLINVIEQLTGASVPSETLEQEARRAVLAGICWRLTELLNMGGNGGFKFNVHDEGRMLMNGVRRGRSGDAEIVRVMTEDDESDASSESHNPNTSYEIGGAR